MKKSVLALLTLALVGCGGDSTKTGSTLAEPSEKVVLWHAMSGGLGEALNTVVDGYNASQDEVEVEAIYQGSYFETLNKFRAVAGTGEAPAMVQVYDSGTAFMSNSGYITPVQEFIDREDFDEAQLEDFILNYYRVDNDLYSMPFNSSSAIMVYNKDAFREAGLDPETAPQSFEEIKEAAKHLTKTEDGRVSQYGFSMLMEAWFFEQILANNGSYFVDNNNGRDGSAESIVFNNAEGREIFNLLKDMYEEGTATSYGRQWGDIRAAFTSEQVAIYMDSSAGLRGVINDADFEVGTGFIPNIEGDLYGSLIGGASIWIANSISQSDQDAAWDFLKFAVSDGVQAEWAVNTGYYPINVNSYEHELMIQNNDEYPQFVRAVDQIRNSQKNKITQGALLGVYPEARERIVVALEENFEGSKDLDTILSELEEDLNSTIRRYNMLNS